MQVVAETVRRDQEEHLEALTVALVDARIRGRPTRRDDFSFAALEIGDKNSRPLLTWVTSVHGETNPHAIRGHNVEDDFGFTWGFNDRQSRWLGCPVSPMRHGRQGSTRCAGSSPS